MTEIEVGQVWEGASGALYRILAARDAAEWRAVMESSRLLTETVIRPLLGNYTLISSPPPADEPAQGATDDVDWSSARSFCRHDLPDNECGICVAELRQELTLPDGRVNVPATLAAAERLKRISRRDKASDRWRLSHNGEGPTGDLRTVAGIWRGW